MNIRGVHILKGSVHLSVPIINKVVVVVVVVIPFLISG